MGHHPLSAWLLSLHHRLPSLFVLPLDFFNASHRGEGMGVTEFGEGIIAVIILNDLLIGLPSPFVLNPHVSHGSPSYTPGIVLSSTCDGGKDPVVEISVANYELDTTRGPAIR